MTGDGERRLRIGIFAEGKPQKLTGRSKRITFAAFLLAFLCAWFAQILASSNNPAISPAFAAGKGKANGNGNGNDNGNGNGAGNGRGNGNAGGNGNGNANGNGNGRANSHSNDITDGNGIGIDLGDGVGVGIGVGNGDTIGVGIGISLGDSGGGHGNQPLEKNVHKDPPRSHGPGVDRWPPGHGADKRKNDGEGDFDLGEHFDAGRIGKAFGDNVDELGKLLGPADVSVRDIGADRENAVGNDDAPAHGEADHSVNAAKAKDDVNLNGAGNGNGNGNGKASGLTKEHGSGNGNGNGKALGLTKEHGNGKALAKGQNKDPEEALAAESAAAAKAGRENSGQGGATTISPGSYVEREVLALGLSPQGISRVRQLGFGMGETGLEQDEKTLVTLYVPARLDALSAISLLRRELPRESLHLNRIYRPYDTATKDDLGKTPPDEHGADGRCCGDKSYGKAAIGWKEKFADCTRDINVGVIDTDVDLQHPAFFGQKITRRAFLADGKRSSPNAHGTGVLALLAGRPDSDTPGLIPEARFFLANVFFDAGNGETITDTVSLLKSLEWMNASQTKVVNMSFAGPQDDLLQVRFKALRAHGVVFTAAAGNEGPAAFPVYPAAYPEVIAVTAITKDRHIYPSANRGPYIDVAAPGVRIWTALPDAREGYRTGTSFATPFVTAVLALQQPDLMYEPKDELLDHLNPVRLGAEQRDPIYGRGLLQAPGECSGGSRPASDWAPLASSIAR